MVCKSKLTVEQLSCFPTKFSIKLSHSFLLCKSDWLTVIVDFSIWKDRRLIRDRFLIGSKSFFSLFCSKIVDCLSINSFQSFQSRFSIELSYSIGFQKKSKYICTFCPFYHRNYVNNSSNMDDVFASTRLACPVTQTE